MEYMNKMYVSDKKFDTVKDWEKAVMDFLGLFAQFRPALNKVRDDILEVKFECPVQTPMGTMMSRELYTFWYDKRLHTCNAMDGTFGPRREKAIN